MKEFASNRIINAAKYCDENKIAIVRYDLKTMKCCGLKPDDLRDFGSINAINTCNESKDWIQYYDKYLKDFKNKKVKLTI